MAKQANPELFFLVILCQFLFACIPAQLPESTAGPVTITFFKRGYIEGGDDITSVTNAKQGCSVLKTLAN